MGSLLCSTEARIQITAQSVLGTSIEKWKGEDKYGQGMVPAAVREPDDFRLCPSINLNL